MFLGGIILKIYTKLNLANNPFNCLFYIESHANYKGVFHAHEGLEFTYIHQGTGHVVYEQRIYEVKPGALFFFQPFELHNFHIELDRSAPYIRSCIVMEPATFNSYLQHFPSLQDFLTYLWKGKPSDRVIYDLRENDLLISIFSRIQEKFENNCVRQVLHEDMAICMAFFLEYLRSHWPEQTEIKAPANLRTLTHVEPAMQWIEQHFSEEFKLDSLANSLHLTPTYISALFQQHTGINITEYLTAKRIKHACLLLKSEELPIWEIGQRVGLENASYFCRMFKKHTGLSPNRYRKT